MHNGSDSNLALVVGLAFSMLLHLLFLPVFLAFLYGEGITLPVNLPQTGPPLLEVDTIKLGRTGERITRIAWIPYDDFRKLVAPQSQSEQPAIQDKVEPLPEAPVQVDPKEQGIADQVGSASSGPPMVSGLPSAVDTEFSWDQVGDLPGRDELPSMSESTMPSVPAMTAGSELESRPTSSPLSEQAVIPVQLTDDDLEARPGGVLVGEGIEIITVRPRFGIITRLTAVPEETRVQVVFDSDGQVYEANLLQSTGFRDVDAAVLASLYKWRARGDKLDHDGVFTVITIRYGFE